MERGTREIFWSYGMEPVDFLKIYVSQLSRSNIDPTSFQNFRSLKISLFRLLHMSKLRLYLVGGFESPTSKFSRLDKIIQQLLLQHFFVFEMAWVKMSSGDL